MALDGRGEFPRQPFVLLPPQLAEELAEGFARDSAGQGGAVSQDRPPDPQQRFLVGLVNPTTDPDALRVEAEEQGRVTHVLAPSTTDDCSDVCLVWSLVR